MEKYLFLIVCLFLGSHASFTEIDLNNVANMGQWNKEQLLELIDNYDQNEAILLDNLTKEILKTDITRKKAKHLLVIVNGFYSSYLLSLKVESLIIAKNVLCKLSELDEAALNESFKNSKLEQALTATSLTIVQIEPTRKHLQKTLTEIFKIGYRIKPLRRADFRNGAIDSVEGALRILELQDVNQLLEYSWKLANLYALFAHADLLRIAGNFTNFNKNVLKKVKSKDVKNLSKKKLSQE